MANLRIAKKPSCQKADQGQTVNYITRCRQSTWRDKFLLSVVIPIFHGGLASRTENTDQSSMLT